MAFKNRYMLGCALWVLSVQAGHAASCSSTYDCTVAAGSYTSSYGLSSTGSTGTQDDDPTNGSAITITNNGSFAVNAAGNFYVLQGYSTGGTPVDESNGGAGSTVTIDNNGSLSLSQGSSGTELIAIDARSVGANADRDNQNNGSPGGNGGGANTVAVTNGAAITVGPSLPHGGIGIYALSQGGTGGEGNTEFGVNQPGGNGGSPGQVTVTNNAAITLGTSSTPITSGGRAWGIRAESNGGGGDPDANGGDNDPASGSGAAGNTVTITNNAKIDAHVDGNGTSGTPKGIYASSVGGNGAQSSYNYNTGGGGGRGGTVTLNVNSGGDIAVSSAKTLSDTGAGVHALSQGGSGGLGNKQDSSGGQGGNGGSANMTTINVGSATITTSGSNIVGALATATGGVGGSGDSENDSSGGKGGDGGNIQVNLTNNATISTTGANSYGVLGQSIGALGGNAGDDTALFGNAGSAGAGGNGSSAGSSSGSGTSITTTGDYSAGIAFQSIGGGGGVGGDFTDVLAGAGGNGGNGGSGNRAAINSSSTIKTSGQFAYGLLAQAISGSGGHGGVANGAGLELGGDGGSGGTGGTAEVLNFGKITTGGYNAHGIVLQSIAGGGGAAGSAGGLVGIGGNSSYSYTANGGAIDLDNQGQITTTGEAAIGIVAQSIGGGGGTGGGATGLETLGGKGSAGGAGGTVIVNGIGPVTTSGKMAHGLVAQSIGGGGGNGGSVLDFSVGVPSVGIGGSGSSGGGGGAVCLLSYAVDGCTEPSSSTKPDGRSASIHTSGDAAIGVIAQSIGGGGGNGGDATGYSGESLFNLQVGGSAGAASSGGAVNVYLNSLTVQTDQPRSIGLVAQSIGGGGGNGGAASGYDAAVGYAAGLSLGGKGGGGGGGGTVTVKLGGSTITTGKAVASGSQDNQPTDTYGIVVQSIGGGGGNGGAATANDIDVAIPTGEGVSVAATESMAVGGSGANGGTGGVVAATVWNGSSVSTTGQGSHGLIVQSIGGGGGNGGDSSALSATVGDENTVAVDFSAAVGGSGSGGGKANAVTVNLGGSSSSDASSIHTADDYANAILAQAIGGGGGNAGVGSSNTYKIGGAVDIDLSIGLGGTGGSGGDGGTVTVTNHTGAAIRTDGSGSRGIVAQSIGGGGGASQGGTVLLGGVAAGYSGDVTVGVGRSGTGGGVGQAVAVTNAGTITTTGGDADGILVQSIGGGGGLGGSVGNDASSDHQLAGAISLIADGESTYTFETSVGGKGGSGATGGSVTLGNTGTIQTGGDWADGIVAQSIGGGGGTGGTATASGSLAKADTQIGVGGQGGMSGTGGAISGTVAGHVTTGGYSAYGLLAQSVGGGGGQGGDGSDKSNATVKIGAGSGVGGSGGASGDGGSVDLTVNAEIATSGDDAHGLILQSIGGGGGTGGAGSSSGVNSDVNLTVTVGGRGGGSGAGKAVTLNGAPTVTTSGDRAFGIVAQSIGGGGGIGGGADGKDIASLSLGGQGGSSVGGGTVSVTLTGAKVTTSGKGAHGVVLQSIGGGGGIGGDSSSGLLSFGGSGGQSTGSGGEIDFAGAGSTITTTGESAFGLIAQSVGGGGGLGGDKNGAFIGSTRSSGSSGADSGNINITSTGDISATGENSVGLFVQSDGATPGRSVITVDDKVTGGTGTQGVGIHVDEGLYNYLTINSGAEITAGSGVAIRYTSTGTPASGAIVSILNNGTIDGSTDTENATTTSLAPQADRRYAPTPAGSDRRAISLVNRGTVQNAKILDADVLNAGTLIVGGIGTAGSTRITGDLTQTDRGIILADLDLDKAQADLLTVDGNADLQGRLRFNAVSLLPGRDARILSVGGALDDRLQPVRSPIFTYAVTRSGNDLRAGVASAHFEAPLAGRSGNERQVARHLQDAWDRGGTEEMGKAFAALDNAADGGIDRYGDALYGLGLGVAAAPAARSQTVLQNFADSLFSCPTFEDGTAIVREGSCLWAQISGSHTDQDANDGADGFSDTGFTYQLGVQNELSPGWFLGVSAAYRQDSYESDDGRSQSDGDSVLAGVTVKREQGPWLFGLGLSGGYGWFDTDRRVDLGGTQATASSDPEVQNVGLRGRASYDFGGESFYLRPILDLDAIYTRVPGYDEKGADGLGLDVSDSDQVALVATPSLELGGRVNLDQGWMFRPFVRGGVSFSDQSDWRSDARLNGAPSGTGTFATEVPIDAVVGRVNAGIQILNGGDVSVRVQYDGEFSDNVTSNGGSVRVSFKY